MNSQFNLLKEAATIIEANYQPNWKVCYPRRYNPPHGYANPSWNAAMMNAHLAFMHRNPQLSKVEVDCILATWKIVESLVPTIFVAQEFAESLVQTDPPNNLTVRELNWPFEGMVFCLPEQFQSDYFELTVPWLRLALLPSGLQDPPPIVRRLDPSAPSFSISDAVFEDRCFIITATVMYGDNPVDYSASFSDRETVDNMMNYYGFRDFCITPEDAENLSVVARTNTDEDIKLLNKLIALSVHLLLAMNAVPEYLEAPVQTRKENVKHGRVTKTELWNPHFFGRQYRWQREKVELGGTHASPRLHPRRGHWRKQPIGTRFEDKSQRHHKIIWIKPMLVNAKPERTEQ